MDSMGVAYGFPGYRAGAGRPWQFLYVAQMRPFRFGLQARDAPDVAAMDVLSGRHVDFAGMRVRTLAPEHAATIGMNPARIAWIREAGGARFDDVELQELTQIDGPSSVAQRIGIFGGTFDPIHVAHLAVAIQARHQLELDRVLLVVAGMPYQKVGTRTITPSALRLALVGAAVAGHPGLEVSSIEVTRNGPSYTIDTIEELGGPGRELFLIIGTDLLGELPTWHRWQELAAQVTLAVVRRPGSEHGSAPNGFTTVTVEVPALTLSSTELRAMAAAGRPLEFLVPDAAISVILEHDLYRTPEEDSRAALHR